ncbi:MAG: hypothetical protein K5883_06765, partial [Pseudobutyrivibrio sp.]|nr:hypothetical protein [Pseudobutyrivibrio sp.]
CLSSFRGEEIGSATYKYAIAQTIPNTDLADALWENSNINDRVNILINYFDYFSYNLSDMFEDMPEDYKKLVKTGRRHYEQLPNTELNKILGKLLKKSDYISNCDEDDDKLIFRVRA